MAAELEKQLSLFGELEFRSNQLGWDDVCNGAVIYRTVEGIKKECWGYQNGECVLNCGKVVSGKCFAARIVPRSDVPGTCEDCGHRDGERCKRLSGVYAWLGGNSSHDANSCMYWTVR